MATDQPDSYLPNARFGGRFVRIRRIDRMVNVPYGDPAGERVSDFYLDPASIISVRVVGSDTGEVVTVRYRECDKINEFTVAGNRWALFAALEPLQVSRHHKVWPWEEKIEVRYDAGPPDPGYVARGSVSGRANVMYPPCDECGAPVHRVNDLLCCDRCGAKKQAP
jgi:hypothetical protein